MPIIFITARGDVRVTVQAMKAGAIEFLLKPFDGEALLKTVRESLRRSEIAWDERNEMRMLQERYASLSSRERQVMALVVAGLLNKQVGARLDISEITVKAHRGSAMRKMGALFPRPCEDGRETEDQGS